MPSRGGRATGGLPPSAADRLAILELYARHNRALDTGDTAGYLALFADDVEEWEEDAAGMEARRGVAAVRARVMRYHGQPGFGGPQHELGSFMFEADPAGRPGHWRVRAYAWATLNRPPAPPRLTWCGHVDDVVGRVGGRWLIRSKRIMGWHGTVLDRFAPAARRPTGATSGGLP